MPLFLSEEQAMLRDSAAPFIAAEAPPAHLRALRDAGDATGFSRDLWRQFGEMGFTGILVPEADGGLGLGHVEAGIVLEEIGRNLTPSPFLSTAVGAVAALAHAGAEQRGRWLPGIVTGGTVAALAIDEGAKHRPDRLETRAERSGNGYRLSGAKRFVGHGHVADLLIVAATTVDGPSMFIVERDVAGVTVTPERLADASLASRVDLDGVTVDADALIGDGATYAALLDVVRTGAAAELLGVGAGAMDRTTAYLKDRKQFGQEIGRFQALQHRAAHLYSELEVARAAVLKAQQLLDVDDPGSARAVAVAKAMSGLATTLAVQEGVQMHGGIGMTDAIDIGLFMKRQRVLAETFGDSDWHAGRLARMDGY